MLALVIFVVVSGVVSALVDLAARRTLEARRARAEAETLARLAGYEGGEDPLHRLVVLAPVGVPAGRGRGAVPCRRPVGGRSLGRCTRSGQP